MVIIHHRYTFMINYERILVWISVYIIWWFVSVLKIANTPVK